MSLPVIHSNNSATLHRLTELELQICNYQGCSCQARLLEEYLDLGLEYAHSSPPPWQANSIQRLFNTIVKAIQSPCTSRSWRQQCLDYLYQPFFVLLQLYQQQPLKKCYLCGLIQSYNAVQLDPISIAAK